VIEVETEAAPRAPTTTEIEVVLSDRVEDVDEALAVVHDGFVEAGYTLPKSSGRRMHAAYLNPGTIFGLARIGDEPVGAVVLVVDGPFGLPSDRAFVEENDTLRRVSRSPVLECGSFAVSAPWRRHTRRVFVRLIGALMRATIDDLPDSPVVIAVTPEMERFYRSTLRLEFLGGPRPLYGDASIQLCTPSLVALRECLRAGATSTARALDRILEGPEPDWIVDRRTGRPLPARWLAELNDEQGVTAALEAQVRLLAARHPEACRALLRDASVWAA
jgi:hypothetical protein